MMTTVLKLNSQQSVILCVFSETSMLTFFELKWPIAGGREKAWPMRKLEAGAVQ